MPKIVISALGTILLQNNNSQPIGDNEESIRAQKYCLVVHASTILMPENEEPQSAALNQNATEAATLMAQQKAIQHGVTTGR